MTIFTSILYMLDNLLLINADAADFYNLGRYAWKLFYFLCIDVFVFYFIKVSIFIRI